MFPRYGRTRLPLAGAALLAVVAVACFLILDLGGSVNPSSLPVIDLGRTSEGLQGQGAAEPGSSGTTAPGPGHAGSPGATDTSTATSVLPGAVPTGTTLHETVRGGLRTDGIAPPSDATDDTDPPGDDY